MGKRTTTWKAVEKTICRKLGGQRRGAYTGDGKKGMPDCIGTKFSVEVKWRGSKHGIFPAMLVKSLLQAHRNRQEGKPPIVVAGWKHLKYNDYIVVMRRKHAQELPIPIVKNFVLPKKKGTLEDIELFSEYGAVQFLSKHFVAMTFQDFLAWYAEGQKKLNKTHK